MSERYRICVANEALIAIRDELANFVQRVVRGRRIHNSTAYRWALRGLRGIRLPTVRIGGRLYTSESAFSWWATELSDEIVGVVSDRADGDDGSGEDGVLDVLKRAGIRD